MLVPRPETELLVELAENGQRVLDVGTGSGAIALAIAQERQGVRVTGIDNSPDAIDVARQNAERHGLEVEFMIADLIVGGPYDLIVSNPPYVRESDWPGLAPEITLYEPREALLGGPDGLDVIRDLVPAAAAGARARRDAGGRGRARASRAPSRRCSSAPGCARSRPTGTWPGFRGWCGDGGDGSEVTASSAASAGGGVVVFPTDTLYGIGCRPDDEAAIERVYALKGRPRGQAVGGDVLLARAALAAHPELGPRTRAALERLLPGPVLVVLPGGQGVRVPASTGRPQARGSPCCRRAPTSPAGPIRGGSRTCPSRSARVPTSCSTAASCPGVPPPSST